MVIACDTSFLFSLYGNDAHSGKAVAWISQNSSPLVLSSLNPFEFGNAVRFSECRKVIPAGSSARYLADFQAAIDHGRLVVRSCNLADVIDEATRLSMIHTLTRGHRGLDILHVAAALCMKATRFLTFNSNQKELAEAEGVLVPL